MGRVCIDSLKLETIIGTLPEERLHRQQLDISLEFDYDSTAAAANDDLTLSVDYSAVERQVVSLVTGSEFLLLEALAQAVADEVLTFSGVSRVKVTIAKPGASAFGAMISYSNEFFRQEQ